MTATPDLVLAERPAAGEPEGLLVLHHGRGTSEQDLLPLADELDPERRLHVAAPRGPLQLPGWPGFHWYAVPRVGYPDPATYAAAYAALARVHDDLWARTGIGADRTVLSGFSMGSVMSYALGLGPDRPRPAGLLIHAGFVPTVPGWEPDLAHRRGLPVRISHGSADPIMDVAFAHDARERLTAAGLDVRYAEHGGAHHLAPSDAPAGRAFLDEVLPPRG
jgi:phospholipase/carboxylesterase